MNNPTMLYRSPGSESFEGVSCETSIVEDTDVDAALAEGWSRNWIEAGEAAKARAEAALKANEEEQARIAAELAAAEAKAGKGKKA